MVTRFRCASSTTCSQAMLAGVVMPVANHHDDAPRFNRFALYQFAAGARQIDGVIERGSLRPASACEFFPRSAPDRWWCSPPPRRPARNRSDIPNTSYHRATGSGPVRRRRLIVFPMDAARRTQIEQEPNHHRLAALPREEAQILCLVVFKDLKVFAIEIGYKAALVIGHRHRHDHFVNADPNGAAVFPSPRHLQAARSPYRKCSLRVPHRSKTTKTIRLPPGNCGCRNGGFARRGYSVLEPAATVKPAAKYYKRSTGRKGRRGRLSETACMERPVLNYTRPSRF